MADYTAMESPRGMSDDQFNRLVSETSKGIASFNQVTRSISQKMSLFGTPQDSRANHEQLKELSDKGNKLVTKITRRLQELNKAAGKSGPKARSRKTQIGKLSADFKNQVQSFEQVCQQLMASESKRIENIRRSSSSFVGQSHLEQNQQFGNYNEDQLYAQANVTAYNEDDLARREEDIIHINHQLREVNAAFQEIDGLVQDQGEVIVEIAENTETAKDNVDSALENVRQADAKASYCACTKWKLILYGGLALVVLLILLTVFKQF